MGLFVTHIITTIDFGGAEKQLVELAACQVQNGDTVEVIFLKNAPKLSDKFLEVGVKVNNRFHDLSFLTQIFLLSRRRSDGDVVVHAHLPRAELLCSFALKSKSFLVTRHNSEQFFPSAPKYISRWLSRFVLARAFAAVSISKAVADYLKTSGELPGSSRNFVIHYGLESLRLRDEIDVYHGSGTFRIGVAARLVPQKNLQLLLDALKILSEKESKTFHLNVAGTGPLLDELKSHALDLGLQNSITWLGQIQDMKKFYDSIDLFVLSSNYEGFGLVLLEAMSHGVPIVARGTSSVPEVLGEEHPGIVESSRPEELALALFRAMNDGEFLRNCLKRQSIQIGKFSIENTRLAHNDIYHDLIRYRTIGNE